MGFVLNGFFLESCFIGFIQLFLTFPQMKSGVLKIPTLCLTLFFPSLQLHNAANTNQKEKYEADLKKEIKKLQVSESGTAEVPPSICSGTRSERSELRWDS